MSLFFSGPGFAFGRHENALIQIYESPPAPGKLAERRPFLEQSLRHHPRLLVFTLITRDASGFPSAEHRKQSQSDYELLREHIDAGVVVIEGESVQKTLFRSFVRTLGSFTARFPMRFFGSVAEGADWAAVHSKLITGTSLREEVECLRGAMR